VDRAALVGARAAGLSTGGWVPQGRLAEDGPLPNRYVVRETPSARYGQRTEWNVRDSDATLIMASGTPTGGTAYTIELAQSLEKPFLVVDVDHEEAADTIQQWLAEGGFEVLNVAGPRESTAPGAYAKARPLLARVFGVSRRDETADSADSRG
jgi:hypothetical protein